MELFEAKNRLEWRNWLEKNHLTEKEVGLVYYKKHTKKDSITYIESVEEALCFGWIDGVKRRIDDERYTHRFTPRRPKSNWSRVNVKLAVKLIKEKKMRPAGLISFEKGIPYREEFAKEGSVISLNQDLEQALRKNKIAWRNFENLAPSYQKQYIFWLNSAKTEPTKRKRLQEATLLLEANKKMGLK